jgi:hypothetical protein
MAKAADKKQEYDALSDEEKIEVAEAQAEEAAAEAEETGKVTPDPDEMAELPGVDAAVEESALEYRMSDEEFDIDGDNAYVVAKPKASFFEREAGADADPDLKGGSLVDHGHGDKVIVVKFDDRSEAQIFSIQEGVMGTLYDREDHALERARFLGEGEN